MFRRHGWHQILMVVLLVALLLIPAQAAFAQEGSHLPPIPVIGPRLAPPPIPHTSVLNPALVYNTPKPPQVAEANKVYNEQPYTFLYASYALIAVNRRFTNVNVYPIGLDMLEWKIQKPVMQ